MFYNPANAQGIQVVVNNETFASAPTPLATNAPYPTPLVEASASMCEVDLLEYVAATFTMEELTSSLVLTTMV